MIASLRTTQRKLPTTRRRADGRSRGFVDPDDNRSLRVPSGRAITTTCSGRPGPARPSPLATVSLLAFRQYTDEEVTVATTLDAVGGNGRCLRPDVDLQLLQRTQAYLRLLRAGGKPGTGLRRAWEEFYRLHRPLVDRVVGACRLSGQDTEDCIQEVWIAILRALPHFRHDPRQGRFCCWFFRLVRNRVVDFVRSLGRGPSMVTAHLEQAVCYRSLDPAAAYEQGRRRRLVHRVLAQLQEHVSATSYDVVYLRWIEGCDVRDVGARLELTRAQVCQRDHRAKKVLRRLLEVE